MYHISIQQGCQSAGKGESQSFLTRLTHLELGHRWLCCVGIISLSQGCFPTVQGGLCMILEGGGAAGADCPHSYCSGDPCPQPTAGYCGRGPLQLSYNYNYGKCVVHHMMITRKREEHQHAACLALSLGSPFSRR